MSKHLKQVIERNLLELKRLPIEKLIAQRLERYLSIGRND
jgi:acetyl-CoA carboxylase alpha subunit